MSWLHKIFSRDNAKERIANANQHREEAAQYLQESREVSSSLRGHEKRNHITDRMAAAFRAREDRRHA